MTFNYTAHPSPRLSIHPAQIPWLILDVCLLCLCMQRTHTRFLGANDPCATQRKALEKLGMAYTKAQRHQRTRRAWGIKVQAVESQDEWSRGTARTIIHIVFGRSWSSVTFTYLFMSEIVLKAFERFSRSWFVSAESPLLVAPRRYGKIWDRNTRTSLW